MNITEKQVKEMPDNRERAKVGDECAALWFNEQNYHFFQVENLGDNNLGFGKDDTVYELDNAYHAVVFSKV